MRLVIPVLALAACATEPERSDLAPRPVHERSRWTATVGSEKVGEVVLLEIEDVERSFERYHVVNEWGQWLGWIDAQGRVWQRAPFQDSEVFRGVYSMEKGLALLYDVVTPVQLTPQGVDVHEASVPRNKELP